MEERVAIIAESSEELLQKLELYLDGKANINQLYEGNVLDNKQNLQTIIEENTRGKAITDLLENGKLENIAKLWVAGASIDWNLLYQEEKPHRITLPTYPFSKERFWPKVMKESVSNQAVVVEVIHPLLNKNTSNIHGLRYSTVFHGNEFFLEDHMINGKKILPGVAYIEMARAALEDLLDASEKESSSVQIQHVVWLQPFEVSGKAKTLHISILPNEYDQLKFTIFSDSEEESMESIVHCEGTARFNQSSEQSSLDIDWIKSECNFSKKSGESFYRYFEKVGINYGPSHRGIKEVYKGENQLIASLSLPEIEGVNSSKFRLHPSLLDSALQATIAFSLTEYSTTEAIFTSAETNKQIHLPFALEEIEIMKDCSAKMWAYIYKDMQQKEEKIQKINIDLCDDEGNICVRIKGLAFRTLQSEDKATNISQVTETNKLLFTKRWREVSVLDNKENQLEHNRIVFLCDPDQQTMYHIETRLHNTKCIPLRSHATNLSEKYTDYAVQLLHETRKILSNKINNPVFIQLFISTKSEDRTLTGLLGFLKTMQLENHHFVTQLVESQQDLDAENICKCLEESGELPYEQHVRYRNQKRYVSEMEQTSVKPSSHMPHCWKDQGLYLITGGAGGLGAIIANEIAQKAKQVTLLLLGRSPFNPNIEKQIKNLEALGAQAIYRQVDVTDKQQVENLIQEVVNQFGAINGVIHCSGIIRDNFIVKKDEEELRAVLAPKVSGIYNLDEATKEMSLDLFIIFSSLAGIMGNIGQADYATGNAFMDSFAEYRNQLVKKERRSGHAISINWPLWRDGGMQISGEMEEIIQESTGLVPMQTSTAIELLYESIHSGQSQALALEGEYEKIIRYLYRHTSERKDIEGSLEQEKENIVQENMKEKFTNILKQMLSSELNLDVGRIDPRVSLETYGINSIMIMQLTNQLEKSFGSLPKTLFFEYQSLLELTDYFCENYPEHVRELTGVKKNPVIMVQDKPKKIETEKKHTYWSQMSKAPSRKESNNGTTGNTIMQVNNDMDIAIIGVSGKYPHANTLKEFWNILKDGKDCITEIPKERWDHSIYYDDDKRKLDKTYAKWGGFLDGIDQFDPLFFNIAPSEAQMLDPQERLFLQCAYNAIEDAGYTRYTLGKNDKNSLESNVGVYVGVMYEEYQLYGAQAQAYGHMLALSGSPASIANRVSYISGFNGPSMAVDTMCSSSLVSIHLACQSIRNGECDTAIAGGVNLSLHPNKFLMLGQNKFMSSKGRCQSFGKDGDGYTPGEGVGAVILKPKAKAIEDGDNIYGIIKGSAVNHGGKTNGYTVPNPRAQTSVISKVLKRSGVDPRTISYIEAHGTGTALGDPIEIAGLNKAFEEYTKDKQFCLVGSVKSNIGHCESAAGIAGLTKVLLQMKHKKIAPSLHSSELNPNIDFEQSPFIVSQKLTDWKRPIVERDGVKKEYPRIAGISAFGAGGANAHLIVEEYIPEEPEIVTEDEQSEDPVMITLSARKEEQLKEVVKQLITWLHDEQPSYEKLKNIAYTLQVGRESMEERLAFIVTSSMDLEEKLTEYLSGSGDYYRGQAKSINNVLHVLDSDQEFQNVLNTWFKLGKYSKILELWVKGLTIDWDNFYFIDERRKRISLPTYPFAKERYWIPEVEGVLSDNQIANSVHYIHPLVHSNSSDFSQQKYSSLFTGEESFFTDHLVNGRKTMPAVAYIEMAYAAIRNAFNMDENDPSTFEFRDITWIRPLTVDNAVEVHIALDLEENSQVSFEIYSESDEGNSEKVIYCEGFAVISAGTESPEIDLRERLNNCNVMKLQSDTIYNQFDSIGIQYGDKQRGIESLNLGKEQVLAHLVLPDSLEASLVDYRLHPCMLDSAFQAAIGMTLAEEQLSNESTTAALAPKLPFMIKRMTVYKDITSIMWSSIRPSNQDIAEKGELLDIDLCNTDGELCVRMEEVYFRSLKQSDRESNLEGHTSKGEAENEKIESLTIIPEWKESALDRSRDTRPYTKRIAILCEVDNHIQQELYTKCTDYDFITIQSDSSNIAHRFQEYAVTILEEIKKLMHSHTQDRNLIQIYIPLASNNYPLLGLASLLKTANLENPTIFGQVIGIEDQHDTNQIATWLVDNATYSQDHSVLYRDGKRLVQTLKEHDSMLPGKPVWKNNGVYLITGGMGGLGLIFAKEIVNKVKNAVIVLTGRSPLTTEKQAKLHELIKNDATVLYESVDVSVKDSVENVIEKIETNFGKITGIIHSAGLVNDNLIYKKTRQEFLDVLTPKIQGIVNLDMASKDLDLDFLVICSSLSGVTGNVGQADYATANAFMDAYATHRNELVKQNQRNGQTLSLNWPLWQDGGMTIDESLQKSIIVRTGMTSLRTETGLELFYRSLSLQESQVIPVEGFADKIRSLLLEHENHNKADVEVILPNREVIEPTNEGLYEKSVLFIKQIFADALMIPIQDIDEDEPLDRYGIDSILIMKLTDILEGTFGSLPKTLLFEYQNINAITKYLVDRHQDKLINHIGVSGDEAHSNKEEIKPVSVKAKDVKTVRKKQMVQDIQSGIVKQLEETSTDNDIAIVGMSGAFAQADDIEEYWKNLLQGRDCITEVPLSRWDHSKYFNEDVNNPGTAYTKWGGFMKNVDKFDPLFFNITPTDAVIMDPQERLFMKSVYEAIEDAGYTRHELGYNPGSDVRRNVGVYVGVMNEDYQLYAAQEQKVGNPIVLSGNPASIANRVSYFFDFHGPSLAIDTMCSSSLVAIHMACQAIKQGECEYAIAGGVNVMSHPNKYLLISQSKFASTNGRCVSFGKDGDGYVPGEGVGTLLLKSKEQAIKDGDHIYGVIKGSSVNHGGKTNGYTVPNPNAQSEVIRTALNAANITPDTLSYIEAHGTGTALGDPIEIIALQKAFGENVDNTQKCAIGSVKSNIGHCESASGIASIAKVLLQMKHKKIVPSLHSSELNPNIDFENSPFYVPQQVMEWNRPKVNRDGSVKEYPRRSGISSFGAGGANAHIILEEFIPNENEEKKEDSTLSKKPVVIVVSSKTKEQLKVQVNNLINAIHSQKIMENNLLDVAYTLQVGREEMEERMAFVSDSVDMLMQKLNEFLTVQENAEGVYYGQVYGKARSLQDYDTANLSMDVQTCIRLGHYEKLCEYWVNGITIDWKSLYQNRPKRVSLPTYPFENERFWVTITPDTPSKETPVAKEIHPLIHENNSSLYRQNFRSNFSGNEFFLKDHCLGERKVLPGAATLEMARFVGKLSLETDVNVLKNVIWINQFEVSNEPKDIEVKVFSDNDTTNYEISTVVEGSGSGEAENELICSEGQLEYRDDLYATLDSKTIHIEDIKSRCHRIEDGNDCYRAMTERGLINGPSFQVIQEIYSNEFEALSFMSLEADSVDSLSHYVLHPALLNGVFQSVLGLMRSQNETNPTVFLPFALSEMKIIEPMTKECIAYVKQSNHTKKSQSSSIQKFDITITDKSGRILAIIDEFTLKAFQVIDSVQNMVGDEYPSSFYSLNNEPVLENQYFMTDWSETFYMEGQEVMNDQAQGTIVIFDQDETLFREIQALYREENHSDVILVKPGETCQSLGKNIYEINPLIQEDYEQIIQMLIDQKTSLTRIIFHTKDGKYARTDDELTEHLEHGIYSLFYLSQALMKQKINYNVQLLFAFENEEGRVIPEYSAVSGFAKTIRMEKPSFTFKTVELQKVRTIHGESDDSHIAKVLLHEFEIEDSEVEIRYEGRNRLVKEVKSI
nr:SDR family NAD(P)-dependent oxidoreductase [Ornithinibacillus scapharcae]